MGRENLFSSPQNLSETRAQKTLEKPSSSSLILVSTSQTKENCLGLALNGSGVKIKRVNAEIPERDWEKVFSRNNLEQHGHFPVIPQALAYAKAKSIVDENPQTKVIAADVVVLTEEGEILGKPLSLEAARIMIAKENGRIVTQTAGTAYWDSQKWTFGQTKVKMTRCCRNEEEIERYLQADPSMILSAAGGLPITDQKALATFYERGEFPVSTFCFNQRGEKDRTLPEESFVGMNNHPLLIQTVLGLSPELLKAMKVI